MTAVDVSQVALDRAARHAADSDPAAAARITWQQADLREWAPEAASYDLVTEHFLHLPSALRVPQHARLAAAVRPGGMLLIVGHHPATTRRCSGRTRTTCSSRPEDEASRLAADGWDVSATSPTRPARDPDGNEIVLTDAVVRACVGARTPGLPRWRHGHADDRNPRVPVARVDVPWLSGKRPVDGCLIRLGVSRRPRPGPLRARRCSARRWSARCPHRCRPRADVRRCGPRCGVLVAHRVPLSSSSSWVCRSRTRDDRSATACGCRRARTAPPRGDGGAAVASYAGRTGAGW